MVEEPSRVDFDTIRDGKHHVRKSKGCNYLEFLDSRWG
jgi:hypothetical protein